MGVADPSQLDSLNEHTATKGDLPKRPVYLDDDDEDTGYREPVKPASKKRKRTAPSKDEDGNEKPAKKSKKGKGNVEEKRLARYRKQAPQSHQVLLERAQTQRMFVIDRTRTDTPDGPSETIEIAGSTGNLYTVVIAKKPSCNCPHADKGNECKHLVYVLTRTLKAPPHLQYQRAFLTSELEEIFAKAPPIPTNKGEEDKDDDGKRKPIEDDCPICCVEFEADDEVLYCKAACGNNVHKHCFEQWAAQKRATGGGVTCPFCRTPWEGQTDKPGVVDKSRGVVNRDGYVNVAEQLGMSGKRDTSTYHSFWVRQQRQSGGLRDEDAETAIHYPHFRNGGYCWRRDLLKRLRSEDHSLRLERRPLLKRPV